MVISVAPSLSFGLESGSGGRHVATVKASTSLRTKKRGKVPPRLETLCRIVSSRRNGDY